MRDDRDWAEIRPADTSAVGEAGQGVLRITLLFGSLAVAIALVLAPMLDSSSPTSLASSSFYGGIDRISTGTTGRANVREYTVRRSVLQNTPTSMCIIHSNGMKSGDC